MTLYEYRYRVDGKSHRVVTDALIELPPELDLLEWKSDVIRQAIRRWAERWGYELKDVWMTLRIAITGGAVSPEMAASMEMLGKTSTLARMSRFLDLFR